MNNKISIITPVYNSERYVNKCVESVLKQTYSNIELILVNDGSTDRSLDVLKKIILLDDRIKLYDKENGGIGSAYNLALQHVTGNYILFLDSDDFLELDACEQLISLAKENDADMVHFSSRVIDIHGNVVLENAFGGVNAKTTNLQDLESLFVFRLKHPSLINLYKSTLFQGVTVFNQNIGIDEMLTPQLFLNIKNAIFTEKVFCNVVVRPDSVSRSKYNYSKLKQTISVFDFVLNFTESRMKVYNAYMKVKYIRALFRVLNDAFAFSSHENGDKAFLKETKRDFRKVIFNYYKHLFKGEFNFRQILQIHVMFLKSLI